MLLLLLYLWDPPPIKKGATLHAGLLKSCETFILYITNAKHKLNFR